MALLCTLHADGPRTLRLLREAGCTTIEGLCELPPDKLGKVLNLAPAAARRLEREARLLLERLEPDLEREEVTYPPAETPLAAKPAPPVLTPRVEPARQLGRPAPELSAATAREHLDQRDRELLERVVQRWREEEPRPEAILERNTPEPEVGEEREDLRVIEILGGDLRTLEEGRTSREARLRPGDVPGLDGPACAALEQGEIASLEDLATIPIDDLVRRTGLTFTRARTLQYLAGRQLSERTTEVPRPVPAPPPREPRPAQREERISPREVPADLEVLRPHRELRPEPEPSIGSTAEPLRRAGTGALGVDLGAELGDGGAAGPFA